MLGFFNPIASGKEASLRLNLPRIDYWLGVGAQTSERVKQLVKEFRKDHPPEASTEPNSTTVAEPTSAVATEGATP
jgi:ribosomal protein S16